MHLNEEMKDNNAQEVYRLSHWCCCDTVLELNIKTMKSRDKLYRGSMGRCVRNEIKKTVIKISYIQGK